ncbi:unnamed protein product, partial [Rhizoctonia solani]
LTVVWSGLSPDAPDLAACSSTTAQLDPIEHRIASLGYQHDGVSGPRIGRSRTRAADLPLTTLPGGPFWLSSTYYMRLIAYQCVTPPTPPPPSAYPSPTNSTGRERGLDLKIEPVLPGDPASREVS